MGLLDEPGLDRMMAAGCPRCGSLKLMFRTYVDARLPLMEAEPVGGLTWIYDGEKFVDGVFEAGCADCQAVIFTAEVCPRCHAPGGLGRALGSPNRWPVPASCAGCEGEEVNYLAFVPARVAYQGGRAEKARTATELHDDGFHGFRVDCRDCGTVAERTDSCPLCDAPAPLRARPG
jgi:RNA polymerase subunit RPABC4/transcription elongation factor Spt4